MKEVKEVGQKQGMIDESELPIKIFIVGPVKAGKTSILHLLFHKKSCFLRKVYEMFAQRNKGPDSWKRTRINENYLERTIAVTIHSQQTDNSQLLIFDLGGQETYYVLQAIFLDVENSFFLLVVSLESPIKTIQDDIISQLSIISSKIPRGMKAEAILIGTHVDLLSESERGEKICACKATILKHKYENLTVKDSVFLNATEEKSQMICYLKKSCEKLAQNVKIAMVSTFFY